MRSACVDANKRVCGCKRRECVHAQEQSAGMQKKRVCGCTRRLTSHDSRNDVFHDLIGSHDAHADDADSGLGSAIGRAEIGQSRSGCNAHVAKEGRVRITDVGSCGRHLSQ